MNNASMGKALSIGNDHGGKAIGKNDLKLGSVAIILIIRSVQ